MHRRTDRLLNHGRCDGSSGSKCFIAIVVLLFQTLASGLGCFAILRVMTQRIEIIVCLSSGEAESVGDDVAHGQIHFSPYQESCRCCCTNNPSQRIAIIHDNFQFNSKSECQLRCTTISLWFIALFKSPRWINWRKLETGVRCCKEIVMEMELITSGANYRRPAESLGEVNPVTASIDGAIMELGDFPTVFMVSLN